MQSQARVGKSSRRCKGNRRVLFQVEKVVRCYSRRKQKLPAEATGSDVIGDEMDGEIDARVLKQLKEMSKDADRYKKKNKKRKKKKKRNKSRCQDSTITDLSSLVTSMALDDTPHPLEQSDPPPKLNPGLVGATHLGRVPLASSTPTVARSSSILSGPVRYLPDPTKQSPDPSSNPPPLEVFAQLKTNLSFERETPKAIHSSTLELPHGSFHGDVFDTTPLNSTISILATDTPSRYYDCGLYCRTRGCNH